MRGNYLYAASACDTRQVTGVVRLTALPGLVADAKEALYEKRAAMHSERLRQQKRRKERPRGEACTERKQKVKNPPFFKKAKTRDDAGETSHILTSLES